MTRRQRLLARYSIGAVVVVGLILGAVWLRERFAETDVDEQGIEDVLARDVPDDAPRVRFLDATADAGIRFRHFPGERSHRLPEDMGSGVAWGDCDDDGMPDLYAVNFVGPITSAPDPGAPGSQLYRNLGNGSFEEIGAAAGVDLRSHGMAAAWGDYDGDGDRDLFVTNYGADVLFRNDGNCRFVDVTEEAGVAGGERFSAGAAWGDYDDDGDLDLYVTRYVEFTEAGIDPESTTQQYGRAVPFTLNPASFDAAPNVLYRNEGDGTFVERTDGAGVANPGGRSLSAVWCDFDQDGDVDLYVANDISDNAFFRNRGDGTFENVSAASMTADYRGAMGLAVADFDRDTDLDFFVTHWIAQENALYTSYAGPDDLGELMFTDVADMNGLGATGLETVGWGTAFLDYDNDGWRDLFVANGHTFEDPADTSRLLPQRMQLFWNRGEEGFYEVSSLAGPSFDRLLVGRGAAAADYDGDGDVDLAVLEHGGGVLLLENDGGTGNHWIEVDLAQSGANRRGLGALLTLETADGVQLMPVGAAPSYLSQDSLTAHFGLGKAGRVDRLVVRWPDGSREVWAGLEVDRRHLLRRGEGEPVEDR